MNEREVTKRVLTTYVYKGNDGISRLCGVCGAFQYVRKGESEEICSVCGMIATETAYLVVSCANPDHNSGHGCGNPACFKHRKAGESRRAFEEAEK